MLPGRSLAASTLAHVGRHSSGLSSANETAPDDAASMAARTRGTQRSTKAEFLSDTFSSDPALGQHTAGRQDRARLEREHDRPADLAIQERERDRYIRRRGLER